MEGDVSWLLGGIDTPRQNISSDSGSFGCSCSFVVVVVPVADSAIGLS